MVKGFIKIKATEEREMRKTFGCKFFKFGMFSLFFELQAKLAAMVGKHNSRFEKTENN